MDQKFGDTPTQAMLEICAKYKKLLDEQWAETDKESPQDRYRRIGVQSALEELEAIRILMQRLSEHRISSVNLAKSLMELRDNALENRTRYEGRMMVHDFIENAIAHIMIDFFGVPPVRGIWGFSNNSSSDDEEDFKIPFTW